jgi:nucleoid-associated protein YgaU
MAPRPLSTSRYRYATFLTDGADVYVSIPPGYNTLDSTDDVYYTVQTGDDVTRVASKALGDPRYWWVVADFNDLLDPFADLVPGTQLRVPSLQRLHMQVLR